jgi:hypothetical protein
VFYYRKVKNRSFSLIFFYNFRSFSLIFGSFSGHFRSNSLIFVSFSLIFGLFSANFRAIPQVRLALRQPLYIRRHRRQLLALAAQPRAVRRRRDRLPPGRGGRGRVCGCLDSLGCCFHSLIRSKSVPGVILVPEKCRFGAVWAVFDRFCENLGKGGKKKKL